jgi:dTDP-glucose pyrophosphorylase
MKNIKKVVIAAAGQGTRMLELTKDRSKHLIEVERRPFLAYLLDNILIAGYTEIILVVGFREDMISEFLKSYKFKGKNYNIEVVNQFKVLGPKEKEYGTACPVKCVKDLIKNENFIFTLGDHFYSVRDLKSIGVEDKYNYASCIISENPERFGVLIANDGFLQYIIEKPKEFVGKLINVSLYKFTPEIFEKVYQIEKSSRGEYEITDAVNLIAEENKVKIYQLQDKDYWIDFGRPEDINKFSDFVKNAGTKTVTKSHKYGN